MASDDDLFGDESQEEGVNALATQPNNRMDADGDEVEATQRNVDEDAVDSQEATQRSRNEALADIFSDDDAGSAAGDETQAVRENGQQSEGEAEAIQATQRADARNALDSSDDEPAAARESHKAGGLSSSEDGDAGADLFGSDDDEAGDKGKGRHISGSEGEDGSGGASDVDHGELFGSDMSGAEEEYEDLEPVHIDITAPRFPPLKGEKPVLAQLPNFLSIETKPFDAETYDEADIEEIRDEDGKTRVRLRVENTIRWRYKTDDNGALLLDDDGQPIKESNAKMVRWDDGTMSLVVGGEVFDIKEKSLESEYSHLYVRTGNTLSAQACFNTRYNFVMSSFQSLTHKRLAETVAGKSKKEIKTRMLEVNEDPRKRLKEIQQKEEDKLKTRRQLEAKRRKVRNAVQYLEEGFDDDYDEEYGAERGDSDSEGERDRERRLRQAKRGYDSSDEDEDAEGEGEAVDEDSEDEKPRRKKVNKAAELFSDSASDEESDAVVKKRAKKKQRIESDDSDE